ncbi:hypothetical protein [Streptomyces sp. NPDC020747]|uniref:hypothetical protein n=1 Tax=Streptomyces sp. NPDC020747 TaxID=3365086 RepID=UPI00379DC9F6
MRRGRLGVEWKAAGAWALLRGQDRWLFWASLMVTYCARDRSRARELAPAADQNAERPH